jgi:type II secretory pathway pseudopilin PulG
MELLVVIVIIGILVSIGVAVGLKVLGGSAKQDTLGAQEMILDAVMRYRDLEGDYPDKGTTGLAGGGTQQLVTDLKGNAETKKMLANNLSDYIKDDKFIDGWGNDMRYTSSSIGDTPALISAGEDGQFGTDDDIRSDAGQ